MTASHEPISTNYSEEKMNLTRLAVSALLTGASIRSRDLAETLSYATGIEISIPMVSAILSKISDIRKSDLGYFIHKIREGNTHVYTLVKEALMLTEERAYGLTVKKGKERYPLKQAVADYPLLARHVRTASGNGPLIRFSKKPLDAREPDRFFRVRSAEDRTAQERTMELSLKYSDQYCFSVTASFTTFVLICAVIVLMIAACCFLAYTFIFPLLVAAIGIGVVFGAGAFVRKTMEPPVLKKKP
jgi:hypothetical protein